MASLNRKTLSPRKSGIIDRIIHEMEIRMIDLLANKDMLVKQIKKRFKYYTASSSYTRRSVYYGNRVDQFERYEENLVLLLLTMAHLTELVENSKTNTSVLIKGGKSLQLLGVKYPSDDLDVIITDFHLAVRIGQLICSVFPGLSMKTVEPEDKVVKLSAIRDNGGFRAICDLDFSSDYPKEAEAVYLEEAGRSRVRPCVYVPTLSFQYNEALTYKQLYEHEIEQIQRNHDLLEEREYIQEISLRKHFIEKFDKKIEAIDHIAVHLPELTKAEREKLKRSKKPYVDLVDLHMPWWNAVEGHSIAAKPSNYMAKVMNASRRRYVKSSKPVKTAKNVMLSMASVSKGSSLRATAAEYRP